MSGGDGKPGEDKRPSSKEPQASKPEEKNIQELRARAKSHLAHHGKFAKQSLDQVTKGLEIVSPQGHVHTQTCTRAQVNVCMCVYVCVWMCNVCIF